MALSDKFNRKQADPSANSKGRAGVLPHIPDAERALVTLDDAIWEQMQHEYHHGREKGQTCHNKYLDRYFKWMPGYTSIITGWPGHGKSQLFFELLLLRAVFLGKKSAVWPSENLPPKRFYQGLIHTLTGKQPDKSAENALSLAEYNRAKDFIREHFILLDPPTGMGYTPAHLLAYYEAAIAKYGGADDKHGIAHCMGDPWNKCDHTAKAKMGGDEPYLVHTLGLCTKWSQDTRQSLVLTAHPKRLGDTEMGYGKTRPVPGGGTISGGQTWENMAHYAAAIHRPFDWLEDNTMAAFVCLKCKDERDVARRGEMGYKADNVPPLVPINWDSVTNRFRWGNERYSPLDDERVKKLYATPTAPPPTQLPFEKAVAPAQPAPTPPNPFPASTDFGHEATSAPEHFGPRQINSDSLPKP
ncbi:MAG: hypothetical protein ACRYFX_09870 [Janthinobacterium lividum]